MARAKKSKESTFFRDFVTELGDVNTHIADDGLHSSEFTGYIDTGSYLFNALLSGTIFGGLPDNKITALAGESATGKTFFALGIIKAFLNKFPDAGVFFYDTEAAVTKAMMQDRGIDTKRVIIVEACTVEEFRTHVSRVLTNYMAITGEKPRMMMVLDSLGQLSTEKEVEDIGTGKGARDMTRAQMIRGAFRALSLMLAKANVSLIVTNHVGDKIGGFSAPGMPPPKVMGGGSGLRYAASQIIFLSAAKDYDKETKEVVGSIIHCKTDKSRLTKQNRKVDVKLTYSSGLDRYWGLLEFAKEHGVVTAEGISYVFGEVKMKAKEIRLQPSVFFTQELLEAIDEVAQKKFKYGKADDEAGSESEDSA